MRDLNITNRNQVLFLIGMLLIAVLIPVVLFKGPLVAGPAIIIAVAGITLVYAVLKNYHYGMPLLFFYSSSIFVINRILRASLPLGIIFEILIVLIFVSMLFQLKFQKNVDWKFKHPVSVTLLIMFGYIALQVANPWGSIQGWVVSLRLFSFLFLVYILVHFFGEYKYLKLFVIVWLSIALLAGSYALYQEIFGLSAFEMDWVNADPKRMNLLFNWGRMRKFSFLSDPSAFGLFSAYSATAIVVLLFGPFSNKIKAILFIALLIIVPGMSFAGTRTAYALVGVSIVFFIILNLRNRKIIVASAFLILAFLAVIFGPFYSPPIQRLRSTFEVSDDPSMGIRDAKRLRFQSYVQTHPIGGGLNTAGHNGMRYARGHQLAGDYDPDSGYLRAALELGSLGLLFSLILNSTVLIVGIRNYFQLNSPRLKIINLAFVVPFLGLSIANFTQDAFFQKPICIVYYGTIALMIKIKDIDDNETEKK